MIAAATNTELTFQKELFYTCLPELPALFAAEWEEVIKDNPTDLELNPSWDKYLQMEINGTLYMLTARVEGKLVGYIISVIHPHLHFSNTLYAFVDAFYLAPKYREDDYDEEFVLRNEIFLMGQGVKRITIAIPAATWQFRLMKKLQYLRTECIFSKPL